MYKTITIITFHILNISCNNYDYYITLFNVSSVVSKWRFLTNRVLSGTTESSSLSELDEADADDADESL